MFPLNDFNFVACALATVTAAMGYRVSRARTRGANGLAQNDRAPGSSRFRFLNLHRRNSSASARSASVATTDYDATEPPMSECGTPHSVEPDNSSDEVEQDSLKRKRSPTPEAIEPAAPPSKRRKTPEPEAAKDTSVTAEEETASQAPQPIHSDSTLAVPTDAPDGEGRQADLCEIADVATTESAESPLDKKSQSQISEPSLNHLGSASPGTATSGVRSPIGLSAHASSWPPSSAIVAAKPSTAFQAFSGSSTAFAGAFSAAAQRSPVPVWSTTSDDVAVDASASDPLAAHEYATSTQTTVTGEEDESVCAELKGAKVFIKRGERDFCEGILGHVKLLKHRETGAERILFRRELVMKVSMNVRLRPLVRCSYDEAQGLLRVTLKELVADTQVEHIVVYALKRGKASRAEFADFAKAVMDSVESRLRAQAPAPSPPAASDSSISPA
ncbi:hypothetical protein C8Q78DRAFT_1005340 [Trametes maxima]|nr:hypothetical protein C8Q78DRAFT_1005340 [Trametes maxima]